MRFVLLIPILLALWVADARAHRTDGPRDRSGIAIPAITHGEMAIIGRYRAEIFALAEHATTSDHVFLTVLRYARLQYADCLWGLVPASIADEASPFNECSHAYLAAVKEVLFKMRDMPDVAAPAGQIVSRISYDAAREGAVFIGCAYSGEGFNTAGLVRPQWHDVPFHPPTILALGAAFAFLPGLAFAASHLGGRRRPDRARAAE